MAEFQTSLEITKKILKNSQSHSGYDHMQAEDEKEMFGLQREILEAYGLKR